ncbi:MAG: steroid 5-alpha reductase family enzyme [Marinobacter maritimus]|jgi:steroid 5-alpha reductase family enzyme
MNMSVGLNLFLACLFAIIVYANLEALANLLMVNAVIQITFFAVVACIPFLRTKRVSYVDIAWPFGVALIGLQILLMGDADFIRRTIVGGIYMFIGLRMGLGALFMAKKTGVIFKTEFPRYKYRRMVLEQSGSKHINAHLLAEIMAQGFANITVLALPGFLIATNSSDSISSLEIIGICLWMAAYLLESVADGQKLLFISKNKRGVCNIGLWKYSRHPNYFAEWLVWTGLVIAAIPSWLALSGSETLLVWICLGVGSVSASFMMYITLVHLTGAIPAEYYSVQKRTEYKEYQEKTNMFFPWFSR